MSSFLLTLSPAELFFLPSGTPAVAPAQQLRITPKEGEPYHALARLVQILPLEKNDAWLYFQDQRRPSDEIIGGGHVCLGCSTCDGKLSTPEALAQQIAKSHRILRYWMPPKGKFAVQLQNDRPLVVATKPHDRSAQIAISNAPEPDQKGSLRQWGHSQVECFCQELWKRDNSSLNQFLQWQSLSDAEQTAAVSTLKHGDWAMMIQMLRLVLDVHLQAFSLPTAMISVASSARQKAETPADKYLLRWRNALLRVFTPAFIEENPPYVRQLRQQLGLQQQVYCDLKPTHHEVVEAQVRLREFLSPYLAKSEIDALFRTDNL